MQDFDDPFTASAGIAIAAIARGDVSAEDMAAHFIRRAQAINPSIGAIRFLAGDDALETARRIDRRRESGGPLPPLAGLPVLIKENCDTDGLPCSAGLSFRTDHRPQADAPVVRRLREAGAVILGVSVSDPGAFGVRTTEVTHPADETLTVGGSSGGSGAALAAGLCLAAIGTDTGGSIRIPSACCGTVGLKPSFGALPMDDIFPLIPSLDHVGPMTKNVADVALVWEALGGGRKSVRPVRAVGYDPRWLQEADGEIADAFASILQQAEHAGMAVRKVRIPHMEEILGMHGTVFFTEGAAYHKAHFGEHIGSYPALAREWFDIAERMFVADYVNACRQRVHFRRMVDAILSDVDLILTPTLSVLHARKDAAQLPVEGRMLDFTLALIRQTCLFNQTGHPALAMPMGGQGNLPPPSLQIIGRHGDEATVLDLARSIEQGLLASGGR